MRPLDKPFLVPLALLALMLVGIASSSAQAQTVCDQHGTITDNLRKSYSEAPVSMGLTPDGGVIEVFASKEGTWTMVVTQPTGMSCLIAVGQSWENLPKPELISGAKI